jgi:uncharacterized membrane protein
MDVFDLLRWLHVIGASVLLGTGAGIAFFMVMAHRSGNPHVIAHTASTVILADFLFTATAVVAQPITGVLLAVESGWPFTEGWILASLGLYVLTGIFWLPVVAIQMKLRNLAEAAVATSSPLPSAYHRLYRIWFACGFPAFISVLAIFWLMLTKPDLTMF